MTPMDIANQLSTKAETVDLRSLYPLPHRIVFRNSWPWLLAYIFAVALICWWAPASPSEDVFSSLLGIVSFYTVFVGMLAVCGKLLFEEFHRATYWYGIEAGSAIVLYGVIVKHRTSLPLSRVSDIYLERNFADFVFGVYSLNFSTATAASLAHAKVHGLRRNEAVALQDYLIDLIKAMNPDSENAVRTTDPVQVPRSQETLLAGAVEEFKATDEQVRAEGRDELSPNVPVEEQPQEQPAFLRPREDPELQQAIDQEFGRHEEPRRGNS